MTYQRFTLPEIPGSVADCRRLSQGPIGDIPSRAPSKRAESVATVASVAGVHADAGSRAHTDIPTVKSKLVSYNHAISTPPEPVRKLECARAPATVATTATGYRAALAAFRKHRPPGVTRFRHDQAAWATEMFLDEWGAMAAELGWSADDIFVREGLAWWLGVETVTALGHEHAVTETRRIYDRATHMDWLNAYGVNGNG